MDDLLERPAGFEKRSVPRSGQHPFTLFIGGWGLRIVNSTRAAAAVPTAVPTKRPSSSAGRNGPEAVSNTKTRLSSDAQAWADRRAADGR